MVILVTALAAAAATAALPQEAPQSVARADHDLVASLAAEYKVDTSDPGASPNGYLQAVSDAIAGWFGERLGFGPGLLAVAGQIALWLGVTVIVLAIALLIRALMNSLRGRVQGPDPAGDGLLVAQEATVAARRDPGTCWRDLETALAAANPAAALVALWWWLASSVAGPAVGPAWTGQDVLRHASRPDSVARFIGRIDTLVYGPDQATVAEVHELALEIRSGLA